MKKIKKIKTIKLREKHNDIKLCVYSNGCISLSEYSDSMDRSFIYLCPSQLLQLILVLNDMKREY